MASPAHASSASTHDHHLAAPQFGHVLRGYDRAAVDAYVAAADRRIAELTAEVGRVHAALAEAQAAIVVLDEPAADLVRTSKDRGTDLLRALSDALSDKNSEAASTALDRVRTECEALLTAAQVEADRMVDTASRNAATVEERARQEYAWRRRQMRAEQTLVDQRKQQIVREIKTLSALATEAANRRDAEAAAAGDPAEHSSEQQIAV